MKKPKFRLRNGKVVYWPEKLAELKAEVKAKKDYEAKCLNYEIEELTK